MAIDIEDGYIYICEEMGTNNYMVKKINKKTERMDTAYSIKNNSCDCMGFKHRGKCKHVQMCSDTLQITNAVSIPDKYKKEVMLYVEDLVNKLLNLTVMCSIVDGDMYVSPRVDATCMSDCVKKLWMKFPYKFPDSTKQENILLKIDFKQDMPF